MYCVRVIAVSVLGFVGFIREYLRVLYIQGLRYPGDSSQDAHDCSCDVWVGYHM